MITRQTTNTTLFLGLLLSFCSFAIAQETEIPGDPIIKMDIESEVEVDLGMIVEETTPLLIQALAEEDEEAAGYFAFLMEILGFDALDKLHMESKESKDKSTAKVLLTLDPEREESLLARFYGIPNGKSKFGKYVSKDELVMYMAIHNFPAYLNVVLDMLAMPELSDFTGELPLDDEGNLFIGDFIPRTDLLPLLSGELDLFILDNPDEEETSVMTAPVFLVLGSTDGFALRNKLLELAGVFGGQGGAGVAEMILSLEPETIGDFELVELPVGGSIAVSQDYLVIGYAPGKMREILAKKRGDLKVPEGLEWVYLNGDRYGAYMDSMMDLAGMMNPESMTETDMSMKYYSIIFDHLEDEEVLYKNVKNGLEVTAEVNGPMTTGVYRLVHALLEDLPMFIEMERQKAENESSVEFYQEGISIIDSAMMDYSADHEGLFPGDPLELVSGGYIDEFPFLEEVPANMYSEGCYTYHALYDEDGRVVGYFFFVYGGGLENGFDVYTDENLMADGNFQIGRDGIADGVASFCYDGIALDQGEAYFK
ncbi:MAG: hypothetical protein GY780_06540 [bacterium]|nr:hypothetical protein [bacterium]